MTRFVSLLLMTVSSACATAPHPASPALAPPLVYELGQFETTGCGDLCSVHIPLSTTRTWGTLELRGDTAILTLESDTKTPRVLCPSVGPGDPFTPCIRADDPRVHERPSHAELQLRGSASRRANAITIAVAVAHDDLHIDLSCIDDGTALDCTVATTGLRHRERFPTRVRLTRPSETTPAARAPARQTAMSR